MASSTVHGRQLRDNTVTPAKATSGFVVTAGTNAFGANQSMGGFRLTSLGASSTGTDAVNKTEMDAAIAAAVVGLLDYKGGTDASSNPNYPAASKGDAYTVTVAGKIGGASGKSVDVGDTYIATADNAGGNEATVGTSWIVLEHNLVGALLAANNLSDVANPATARTNLGATTVGGNIFTAANPSAVRYIRINADNTISLLDAGTFLAAIGGGTAGTVATRETPSGTVNGSNDTFTLANTPTAGTEEVYVNGILQDAGSGNDYTISGATIIFEAGVIPQTGDKIRVTYWY